MLKKKKKTKHRGKRKTPINEPKVYFANEHTIRGGDGGKKEGETVPIPCQTCSDGGDE